MRVGYSGGLSRRQIAVLGAGSFGTALAIHLSNNGSDVSLWFREATAALHAQRLRENKKYLPAVELPLSLAVASDLHALLADCTDVLIAVPSHAFESMLEAVATSAPHAGVVWACKGLQPETGRFLDEAVVSRLPQCRHAVISGPTFAAELAAGLPTALTVAASDSSYADQVADWFHSERFRAYTTDDIKGVQLGGALKNVYAIAAGISDGLSFGANARVALITRGLAELSRLGGKLGARNETLAGLSGTGDLVLTCTDDQSRNRQFGLALARGLSTQAAVTQINRSVEGIAATRAGHALAARHDVEMPIVEQVYKVIEQNLSPDVAVAELLARSPRRETD